MFYKSDWIGLFDHRNHKVQRTGKIPENLCESMKTERLVGLDPIFSIEVNKCIFIYQQLFGSIIIRSVEP